jgi:hypothetical protein
MPLQTPPDQPPDTPYSRAAQKAAIEACADLERDLKTKRIDGYKAKIWVHIEWNGKSVQIPIECIAEPKNEPHD